MSDGRVVVRRVAFGSADFAACEALRREVFVREQGVTEDEEMDGLDHECVHFLALDEAEAPVGTARLRFVEGEAKAERVAVRAAQRRAGVGAALMAAVEAEARARGASAVRLYAQEGALPFYTRLGYAAYGEPFVEARIPHRAMRKPL